MDGNTEQSLWTELTSMTRKEKLIQLGVLVGFLVLCLGGGAIVGAITANDFGDSSPWYVSLKKPCFNPPSAVFGPVWSILYLLMAIAAFVVWRNTCFRKQPAPLIMFFVQLLLNFVWVLIFGIGHDLFAAFVEILYLWVAIFITIILFFRVRSWVHFLLLPYLAWVTFASVLNYSLWQLNK